MRSSHMRLGTPIIVAMFVAAACGSAATPTPVVTSAPAATPTSTPVTSAPSPILTAGPPPSPSPTVSPTPGELDAPFGRGGLVVTDLSGRGSKDHVSAIAIQADGAIVLAGGSDWRNDDGEFEFVLARFDADGNLDQGFRPTRAAVFGRSEEVSLGIQADGKFVVAGSRLVRYNADGSLDTNFGNDGSTVDTNFGRGKMYDASHGALAIQRDGKIVLVGSSFPKGPEGGDSADFALERYTSAGSLDPSFGNRGTVLTNFHGESGDVASDLAILSDGTIVVAGSSSANGSYDFALARYRPNGSLDPSFGDGGTVVTDVGGQEYGRALAIQGDGKIVLAGDSCNSGCHAALARYNPDGSLDSSFGSSGLVVSAIDDMLGARTLAIQGDGKIVLAGTSHSGATFDFALARYNDDGTLDPSFGNGGIVVTDLGGSEGSDDLARALAIQGDGKIVLAGDSGASSGSSYDLVLARYDP